MGYRFKNIFIILICLFLQFKANAETLTFKNVMTKAIENSFDVKMATLDIDISKAELKSAKADRFPIIAAQANTEHNQGLGNYNTFGYAGTTVVSSITQYRNLGFLSMNYNLFDFGATGKKILIAKKDVDQKKVMLDLQIKDLKLKILQAYTKSLQANEQIKTQAEILKVYEEMFRMKERMFQAGVKDKISVMDEAVKIARAQDEIYNSKLELKKNLNELSKFTQQKYNTDKLEILDLEEMNIKNEIVPVKYFEPLNAQVSEENFDLSFNPKTSLEAKFYDFEIEKKKAELEMYKRQRYPSFKFYTNYSLYGQDPSQYGQSVNDLQQRSWAIGISGSYTLFDGFKNKASREKAALEIKKLELEKEKKLHEIESAYNDSYDSFQIYSNELCVKKDLLKKVTEKLNAIDRMNKNGIVDKTQYLTVKADLLNQENDLQKNICDISSKIKEIQIMTGKDL